MAEKGIKKWVPEKLRRFLRTTAIRDNISATSVAAVIITKKGLMIREGRLPSRQVDGDAITEALQSLLDEMDAEALRAGYIGYCDCEERRQYNFWVDAEPARPRGPFRKLAIEDAIAQLGRCEVRAVMAAIRKKRT